MARNKFLIFGSARCGKRDRGRINMQYWDKAVPIAGMAMRTQVFDDPGY